MAKIRDFDLRDSLKGFEVALLDISYRLIEYEVHSRVDISLKSLIDLASSESY